MLCCAVLCRYCSVLMAMLSELPGCAESLYDGFAVEVYHLMRTPKVGLGTGAG